MSETLELLKRFNQSLEVKARGVMSLPGIKTTIYPTYVECEMGNGLVKVVDIRSFISSLSVSSGVEETSTPIRLPEGIYLLSKTQTTVTVAMYFEERIQDIKYKNGIYRIPFPNTIVVVYLKFEGNLLTVNYASTKYMCTPKKLVELPDEIISHPSYRNKIYMMPFTNFYSDGMMCFGSAVPPVKFKLADLRGLSYYYQIVIDSIFNDHVGVSNVKGHARMDTWLPFLAQQKAFPYELLTK